MAGETTVGARPRCMVGVAPEEVAAWAIDGEPMTGVDLVTHVPECAACRAVVAAAAGSRQVGDTLRAAPPPRAPTRVTDRAVGRIRVEATLVTLMRALGGGWWRVAQSLPDYARFSAPRDEPGDTGELPAMEAPV